MKPILDDLGALRQMVRLLILRRVDDGIGEADLERLLDVLWSIEAALHAARDELAREAMTARGFPETI
jgi:hypothetical protein